MSGFKSFMREMIELKSEIADEEAAALIARAKARAANAAGFKARAMAAKAALAAA